MHESALQMVMEVIPEVQLMSTSKRWWRTGRIMGIEVLKEMMLEDMRTWNRTRMRRARFRYVNSKKEYYKKIKDAKRRTWEDFMMSLKG
jgi:hypothetical protein